jgi:DNA-binding LacI/PurR family transcriptional regulator
MSGAEAGRTIGRPPTIREVARAAGVSPMTVSRVLTGRGYVAEETANRVREAFARLEYHPNPAARSLRNRRGNLIGVTVPTLSNAVHRGIVAGLEEALGGAGYELLLGHTRFGRDPSSSVLDLARRQRCDGYAIVPSRADVSGGEQLAVDRPTVVVHSMLPGTQSDTVVTDGRAAACEATRYLADRFGRRVVCALLETGLSHEAWLERGYVEAMDALGSQPTFIRAASDEPDLPVRIERQLADTGTPDAVLVASTVLVFDVLSALRRRGLGVGSDVGIALAVAEERPWLALLPMTPPLLEIPTGELGRRAGELLLQRIDEPSRPIAMERLAMRFVPGAATTA